jgi:hypothetical protein
MRAASLPLLRNAVVVLAGISMAACASENPIAPSSVSTINGPAQHTTLSLTITPLNTPVYNVHVGDEGTAEFQVTNSGSGAGSATLSCSTVLRVTCTGIEPSTVTLNPNQSVSVAVSWLGISGPSSKGLLYLNSTYGSGYPTILLYN